MRMTKAKTAEDEFLEAVESGDNLAILKAQRKLIAPELVNFDLEADEKSRLHRDFNSITKEIIKLEGSKETQSEEDEAESDEIRKFQDEFRGGQK
jgi:hypothetical protein